MPPEITTNTNNNTLTLIPMGDCIPNDIRVTPIVNGLEQPVLITPVSYNNGTGLPQCQYCSKLAFSPNTEFDGEYMLGETVLIPWDQDVLCTVPLPNKVSINIKNYDDGLIFYNTIASDISPNFKSDPNFSSFGNFNWTVNQQILEDNKTYLMILQNEDTGTHLSSHIFTINGSYTPPNCGFSVNGVLDGDYRIRFDLNNNNNCYNNILYSVDFGDNTNTSFIGNNNALNFTHQYPFGTYSIYNVTITKSNASTGQFYSEVNLSVIAKRD